MRVENKQSKLRELILFVCSRSELDERFGSVKLNKLLFYSDFHAYAIFGESITGANYQALEQGPAPTSMVPVLKEMENAGEIAIRKVRYYGWQQHKVFALRPPKLSAFKPDEIALVDDIIRKNFDKNGTDISSDSHKFIGWKLAARKEIIPYEMALVARREPGLADMEIAKQLESAARKCLGLAA